ncbi:unnamed protein product [Somion occarium]|uniref:Uncharacterized protein n=1 Tax=Somion occarium TaxID=3059160 RepID=A0ABP1CFR5_9APHY
MDIDGSRDAEELNASIAQAQRLTTRLRGERDALQRDYDFHKLETAFKVESLEKQLQEAQSRAATLEESQRTAVHDHIPTVSMHAYAKSEQAVLVSALVVQHLQFESDTQKLQLASVLQCLDATQQQLDHVQELLRSRDTTIHTLQHGNVQLQGQLDASEEQLSATKTQVRDLTARIAVLEQDTERERRAHEEMGNALARTEAELVDVSRTLADAESIRDSHSLRITHLEQDLGTAHRELEEAESRYTELQSHQLSAMSSSEATRALRKQIMDLEARVMRRTEQIGVHQHDIKRLETNLKLQEDRLAEMTAELEVAETEKAAMVEDCETTREERDRALKRCEGLEESMEVMEDKITQIDGQRDVEIQSLVEIILRGVSTRRNSSHATLASLSQHAEAECQLRARLLEVDQSKDQVFAQIQQLQEAHRSTQQLVEEKTHALQSLEAERDAALAESRAARESLQTAHINSRETTSRFDELRNENASLQKELEQLRQDLRAKVDELFARKEEYGSWQIQNIERTSEDRSRFEARIAQLEDECQSLHEANEDLTRHHSDAEEELKRTKEELHLHASTGSERELVEKSLREDLAKLRNSHEEETKRLRDELALVHANLEDAKQQQVDLETLHQVALNEASRDKDEIERQLKETIARLNATVQAESDLKNLRAEYNEQVNDLEERLRLACADLDSVSDERENLRDDNSQTAQKLRDTEFQLSQFRARYDTEVEDLRTRLARTTEELEAASKGQTELEAARQSTIERLQTEASEWSQVKTALEAELTGLRDQHAALETRLTSASSEREATLHTLEELKSRHEAVLQELTSIKADGDGRLAQLTNEVEQVREQLKAQVDEYDRLRQQHSQALIRSEQAEQAQRELSQDLDSLTTQLQETDCLLGQLKDEKQQLLEQMTDLEAQVQRSLSMQRHQDSQIKEREQEIAALAEKLNLVQSSFQQSEQAAKATEIKLSFEIAQDEQTIASLRREVESLRGNASLQETIADLREKNEEMEQLLRAKCLEIEENDDRFIELIKEKKKLNNKIDSLGRKVANLQAKLAAATEINPLAPVPAKNQPQALTSTSRAPAIVAPQAYPTPSSSRSRTLSGPSVLARPKTPEHRVPPPPVFRARTPESKRLPSIPPSSNSPPPSMPMSSSSSSMMSAGKKRRAPDDFEDGEGLPPQVFTSDSVPSQDPDAFTPRIRRALHSVRTGFTPIRNSATRPHPNQLSPRRATTGAPIIADVTNSPRGHKHGDPADKAMKRGGWLGKMRGGQAPRSATMLSQPVFERPQSHGGPSR